MTSAAPSPSPTRSPTPDPTPTSHVLSIAEAGELYLDIVCASNATGTDLEGAFEDGESEFLAGGDPDVSAVNDAAARLADQYRKAAELFDDDYFVWPDEVRDLGGHVRDRMIADLGTLSSMTNAVTYRDAYYASFGQPTPEQESAAQEIRYVLDLPSDTVASCAGHEGGLQERYDAFLERGEGE
ncbi:hypothetical protein [Microbacterium faecale]|nr:hypothetical protein [Microbacterium faecale]